MNKNVKNIAIIIGLILISTILYFIVHHQIREQEREDYNRTMNHLDGINKKMFREMANGDSTAKYRYQHEIDSTLARLNELWKDIK